MIQPKYDSRQVFFVSIGLILLAFGFWPFYMTKSLNMIATKMWVFHLLFVVLGGFSSVVGIKLWKQKDKEITEVVKFFKEEMKVKNELRKLEIEKQKLNIEKDKLAFNLQVESQKVEEKRKEVKKLARDFQKKDMKLKEMRENIEKKEKKLLEKEMEIYNKRNKSINELPSTSSVSPWITPSISLNDLSTGSQTSTFSSNITPFSSGISSLTEEKVQCLNCSRVFYVAQGEIHKKCPYCHYYN
ncbi:MAG: hypothetical protein KAT43_04510 [Nanoarchaeota archaeon]|nr:hypothetical protein [Nanoarchaeota archaeon]